MCISKLSFPMVKAMERLVLYSLNQTTGYGGTKYRNVHFNIIHAYMLTVQAKREFAENWWISPESLQTNFIKYQGNSKISGK